LRSLSGDEAKAEAPTRDRLGADVLDELNRLRLENEKLRGLSVASALTELLEPILREAAPPDAPGSGAGDLAGRLVAGLSRFLRRPEVHLFGTPGEAVTLRLPHPEYQL